MVQGALKLILEPIFEADFQPGSFGYRPKRTAHEAVHRVAERSSRARHASSTSTCKPTSTTCGITSLLAKVAERVDDADVLHLLKMILKASGKKGVPQGGVISPLLSNLYLNEVDRMLERAKEVTRRGEYTYIEYARYADDLVILVDGHPQHDWLLKAVDRRLREELAKLGVEVNEEKSRVGGPGEGGELRVPGLRLPPRPQPRRACGEPTATPKLKKRTALLRKLKEIFRRFRSQPVGRVVELINPILRGWVNYFAVGHSSRCFWLRPRLGGEEDAAAPDACPAASGLRLAEVE